MWIKIPRLRLYNSVYCLPTGRSKHSHSECCHKFAQCPWRISFCQHKCVKCAAKTSRRFQIQSWELNFMATSREQKPLLWKAKMPSSKFVVQLNKRKFHWKYLWLGDDGDDDSSGFITFRESTFINSHSTVSTWLSTLRIKTDMWRLRY